MADAQKNHAIVFGATGLIGWSAVNQLLSGYPNAGSFSKVTAVINRPVPESDLYWPIASPDRPQLKVVSGIDLLGASTDELISQLKQKVSGVEQITHAFYFGKLYNLCKHMYAGENYLMIMLTIHKSLRQTTMITCKNATRIAV